MIDSQIKQIVSLANELELNLNQVREGIKIVDETGKVRQANLEARKIEEIRQKESKTPSRWL
jgi:sensor histidine kinase regulating citrate/malate metabolism